MADRLLTPLDLPEASSPGTPSAGFVRLYGKADGGIYGKDSAGVESNLSAKISAALAGIILPNAAAPSGMVNSGAALLGMNLAVADDLSLNKLTALYAGNKKGITILPSRSRMWQDTGLATPATTAADPVRTAEDLSPNNANGVASATGARPTLRKSGGATWLECDGTDDDLHLPNAQFNQTAMTIIASVELRANGNFPMILSNTAAASGVYFGFNGPNRQPRISIAGGTAGAKNQASAGAVALNTRVTLTLTIDNTEAKIYQNGVLILTMATGGDWGAGTQYRLFSPTSPINVYGLILVEGVLSTNDRLYYEGLVALNDQWITSYATQKAIDAAVASILSAARSGLPYTLWQSTSEYSLTGTTTETKIGPNIPVPANTLGSNSQLMYDVFATGSETSNIKTLTIRMGPNGDNTDPIICIYNFGGKYRNQIQGSINCLNSATVKAGILAYTSGTVPSTIESNNLVPATLSIDNSVQNIITVWLKNNSTGITSYLQGIHFQVRP